MSLYEKLVTPSPPSPQAQEAQRAGALYDKLVAGDPDVTAPAADYGASPPQGWTGADAPLADQRTPKLATERGGAVHPPLEPGSVAPPSHSPVSDVAKKIPFGLGGLFAPAAAALDALTFSDPIDVPSAVGGPKLAQKLTPKPKLSATPPPFERTQAEPGTTLSRSKLLADPANFGSKREQQRFLAETTPERISSPSAPVPARPEAGLPSLAAPPAGGGRRSGPPGPPVGPGIDEPAFEGGTWRFEPRSPYYDAGTVPFWKDPNKFSWERFKKTLPQDYFIAVKQPESPVIGEMDRVGAEMANWADDLINKRLTPRTSPIETELMDALNLVTPQELIDYEAMAVAAWKQSRGGGLPGQQRLEGAINPASIVDEAGRDVRFTLSNDEIINMLPAHVRPIFRLFQERMAIDQQSRAALGLGPLDEVPYPYLPRLAVDDTDRIVRIQRGDGTNVGELRQTIGSFQRARTYDTAAEGLLNGQQYEDPKRAVMLRLMLSKQLEYTARMMQNLQGRVLFNTPQEAAGEALRRRHASMLQGARPLEREAPPAAAAPVKITGLPGDPTKTWWIPSAEEANSLHQHLIRPENSYAQSMRALNYFFRNPNLLNPFPHIVKNMGYKYVLAAVGLGKSPHHLAADAAEFLKGTNPALKAEFLQAMPFTHTGKTAYDALSPYIEANPAWRVMHWIGANLTGNAWSSKFIFSKADPAMKYSLWKMYRERGLSADAAANQVNIDLVRYTLRSEATDTWKAMPLNFFVPWRVGTIMATTKQMSTQPFGNLALQQAVRIPAWAATRPFKTALLIGAIGLMREAYHRDTGFTFHLPIDYTDGPVAQIVTDPKGTAALAASWAALGPGGNLERIFKDGTKLMQVLSGSEDWDRLKEMYWGIGQLYGGGEMLQKALTEGDGQALTHFLMSALTAEYQSYSPESRPKHLEDLLIPEAALPTNPEVAKRKHEATIRDQKRELQRDKSRLYREKRQELERARPLP